MDDVNSIIGQNIAKYRRRLGLSQKELANQLTDAVGHQISASMISYWERSITLVPAAVIPPLCRILRCTSFNLYPVSDKVSQSDIFFVNAVRNTSDRERSILLYLLTEWRGDPTALWELGLLYAVLPEDLRAHMARTGVECYRDAQANCPDLIDDTLPVDLIKIIRGIHNLV